MKDISIVIAAHSTYLPEQSAESGSGFMWKYEITINNESDEIVQLLNRYWRITDMTGHVEEVRGLGVVGLQPVIKPQKQFVYASLCHIPTPQGNMEGHYEFQTLDEERFLVSIPKFYLTAPEEVAASFRARLH